MARLQSDNLTVARTEQHDARAPSPSNRSHRMTPHGSARTRRSRGLEILASPSSPWSAASVNGAVRRIVALPAPAAAAPRRRPRIPTPGAGSSPSVTPSTSRHPDPTLSSAITGMAVTPDGEGYWLVGTDGGIFAYGDAPFYGSLGSIRLNGPVVAITSTPDGEGLLAGGHRRRCLRFRGRRLLRVDGRPHASPARSWESRPRLTVTGTGSSPPTAACSPSATPRSTGRWGLRTWLAGVTGIAATNDGKGYWMVAGDGGVFAFGDATFYGSSEAKPPPASIAGMATTPDGDGYWMVGNDGSVYTFGDAPSLGSTARRSRCRRSPPSPPPQTARGTGCSSLTTGPIRSRHRRRTRSAIGGDHGRWPRARSVPTASNPGARTATRTGPVKRGAPSS